jgi:hypothetical protein
MAAEGMAAHQPPQRERPTANDPVALDRFTGIR